MKATVVQRTSFLELSAYVYNHHLSTLPDPAALVHLPQPEQAMKRKKNRPDGGHQSLLIALGREEANCWNLTTVPGSEVRKVTR